MNDLLRKLGLDATNLGGFHGQWLGSGPELDVITPIDGSRIATVRQVTEEEYDRVVDRAHEAFLKWRTVPAPKRGEVVRLLGDALQKCRDVTDEAGAVEALGLKPKLVRGDATNLKVTYPADLALAAMILRARK